MQNAAPPDVPFAEELRTHLASVSRDLGIDSPTRALPDKPSEPFAAAGPNASVIQPAQEERIRGMVEGLAQRLKDTPDDADGWRMLGKSYGVLGNHTESIQAYARLVALRPDDPAVYRLYAEAVLKTAHDSEPYPSSLSEPLNWLYRWNPKDEFALFHLGELNSRTGNREKAVQYWRNLLEILPENALMRAAVVLKLGTRME